MDNTIKNYLFPINFINKWVLEKKLFFIKKQLDENTLLEISLQYIHSIDYSEDIIVLLAANKEELLLEINVVKKYINEFTEKEDFVFHEINKIYYQSKPIGNNGKVVFMNPPGGMVNFDVYKKYNPMSPVEDVSQFNLIEKEEKKNELMKRYMEEVRITAASIRMLNNIGIRPDILVGASMGEIALLLSLNLLETHCKENDKAGIIQRICSTIKAILDNQEKSAENYYGSKPENWEKWYFKGDIFELKKLIEPLHNIFIIIIGSDNDAIITGELVSINFVIQTLKCFAKKLDDPSYIHTEILEKMYSTIYDDCLKENVYLDTENTTFDIYSNYLGRPLDNTAEAFANSIASVLTKQIDFSSLLKNIYIGGGRVFIDLSTNGICYTWAKECFKYKDDVKVLKTYSQFDKSLHMSKLLAVLCSEHIKLDYDLFYHIDNKETYENIPGSKVKEVILKQLESNKNVYQLNLLYKQKLYRMLQNNKGDTNNQKGCLFDRNEMELMTDGSLSAVLGEEYKQIDSMKIRARMPSPPYLFVSRVISMDAEFMDFRTSKIVTEYDFTEDCILRTGVMEISPVVASEASHAGIFLASVIGVDSVFKGNARFRIVSASTITKSTDKFKVGDTMRMEFNINEFFYMKEVLYIRCSYKIFLYHNLVSETKCIAGFFTDIQLKASKEKKAEVYHVKNSESIFTPPIVSSENSYSKYQVGNFLSGNYQDCFYDSNLHPSKVTYRMKENAHMIDRITEITYQSGKYGLGYIKSEKNITEHFWPFRAHFKNDPVLPGTIMIEGINQTIQLYAVHLGIYTVIKDAECTPTLNHISRFSFIGQILPQEGCLQYCVYLKEFIKKKNKIILIMDAEAVIDNSVVLKQDNISLEYFS